MLQDAHIFFPRTYMTSINYRYSSTLDILPALKREDSSVGGSAMPIPRGQLAGLCALLWDVREGMMSPTTRGRPTRIARAVPSA